MNWDSFVKGSLKALHSGSDVPNYFGCLIPVLSSAPENTISQTESQISEEEQNPASYEKYSQQSIEESEMELASNTTDSLNGVHNLEPEEEPMLEEEEEHHEEEVLSDIPKEEVQSFDSPIKPARHPQSPGTPQRYSDFHSDEDTMLQEHNISLMDLDDHIEYPKEEKKSLAEEFQILGEGIMDRYWSDIDGLEVPRLNRQSKVMVTFRVNRFMKLQKAMIEKFNAVKAEANEGVITFKRVK